MCALIGTINKTIDAVTIVRIAKGYLGEAEAIKQYGILSGKVESLIVFPLSFNMAFTTALIPKVSEYKAKGEVENTKNIVKLAILAGIIIGIPCFIGMFCFSTEILNVLFPKASEGNLMLKYSSITIIMAIIAQTINSYLQGIKKMRIQIVSVSVGTIAKLVLNIILIQNREIGIYGAIISNIISYFIILIILLYYLIKKDKIHFEINKFLIKPTLLAICMYIILKTIYNVHIIGTKMLNLLFSFTIGGLCYLLLIITFKIISKKDIKIATKSKHKT